MRSFAVSTAVLALAGCGLFSSPSGPKPAPLPALERGQEVRVLWTAQVGSADRFVFAPASAGDAVFSAARDGTVVRLDAASGAERWRASTERRLSAGVGTDGRIVAVATEEGEVVVLDAASGALRWRARVSSEVLAPPVVGNGLVLVRTVDNRIFAFAEQDGKRRWVYQRAPASLIVRSPAGMSVLGDTVFAGFSGGKLAAIALSNGGVRWEATVALPRGATELERVTDVVGEPVLQGREVCAAAYQGRVACYDVATGRQLWARDVSSLTGVSLDARYALVSDDRGGVHALDRTNGRSVWKQDRLTHRQLSRPASTGATIAVGDFEGHVHFLARDSGAFVARYSSGGGAVRAAPLALPFGLLVQTQNGTLVALAL
ncbi:MAG: outer membrane protein assembly factor BamB [Betaproteobacteria bacterium RIFCSPLOWO2_12_FULL_65_14]|nr:MAG: outer membrane protein assembly factor BamB [Betaproteobacteria bacterium RIFCSPLOWO2_12_FULL_65_14]